MKTRMRISLRIVRKIGYLITWLTWGRKYHSLKSHDFRIYWEIRDEDDNLLILIRISLKEGFCGGLDWWAQRPGERDSHWKNRARKWSRWQLHERFSSAMTRGARVVIGESNFRYALQLFALHVTSSLCGHLRKWHVPWIPLSVISSSVTFGENPDFCQPSRHSITNH